MFNKTVAILLIIFSFIACKDIVEEDLSDKTVSIIAPTNNLHTTTVSQTFWWEEVEGATSYCLQVVDSSFSYINRLVLDTTISATKLTYTLYPGKFEWRVMALNGNTHTPYSLFTITIDSTSNLSGQQVNLILPSDIYLNHLSVKFKWQTLYNASDYRFEVKKPDWNGTVIYGPEITSNDSVIITLAEGFYTWGVQAQNSTSTTIFSTQEVVVDTTRPATPTLIYPSSNATINDSTLTASILTFVWGHGPNAGSPLRDTLFLSTDSLFSASGTVKILATDTVYSYSMQNDHIYYWRVRPYDLAGNIGKVSSWKKFTYEK